MILNTETAERPVCVVGGSGQIGDRVARGFCAQAQRVAPTYYYNPRPDGVVLDASNSAQVHRVIEAIKPWLIVNSVNARGGTDACESDPGLACRAHFETARNLIDAAKHVGARFVQVSTDYVFDGQAGPYDERAMPHPLSQLGKAKLQAERYALEELPDALVLRTSFVFSWSPQSETKNFVMQLLEHDQHGQVMRVPYDQVGNVTYAPNFASALVELVEVEATGIYHVAGTTRCSKYDWALRVADFFGLNRSLIQGVSTKELGQAGPRPLESGFRLQKVQRILKRTRLMSLDESLTAMAAEMQRTEPVSA